MKILVPIKRVVDANVHVRVNTDHSGVDLTNVKMAMNPFCEIALEQAVRLRESGTASEVVVVSVGTAQDTLRTGLAMGADRAVHVRSNDDLEPLAIAKILKSITEKEKSDLVFLGKQSIDGDNNQTGQMLAGLLGWAQGTFISDLAVTDNSLEVTREIDGGLQKLTLTRPAVLTADLRLNEPRFASLPNIMKARKKPIEQYTTEDLGVDTTARLEILKVEEPPARTAGIKVNTVNELLDRLKKDAGVI